MEPFANRKVLVGSSSEQVGETVSQDQISGPPSMPEKSRLSIAKGEAGRGMKRSRCGKDTFPDRRTFRGETASRTGKTMSIVLMANDADPRERTRVVEFPEIPHKKCRVGRSKITDAESPDPKRPTNLLPLDQTADAIDVSPAPPEETSPDPVHFLKHPGGDPERRAIQGGNARENRIDKDQSACSGQHSTFPFCQGFIQFLDEREVVVSVQQFGREGKSKVGEREGSDGTLEAVRQIGGHSTLQVNGNNKLLEKLILRPEAPEKASKSTLIISADLRFPSKKRIRSSANWSVWIDRSPTPTAGSKESETAR